MGVPSGVASGVEEGDPSGLNGLRGATFAPAEMALEEGKAKPEDAPPCIWGTAMDMAGRDRVLVGWEVLLGVS